MRRQKAIVFTEYIHKLESVLSAKEAGFATILVTQKKNQKVSKYFDEIIQGKINDPEALEEIARNLKQKYNVKAVVSNYENFVVQRSYLAERLGVPSCSVYAACCTRNKALQRHMLSVMPENIDFRIVSSLKQAQEAYQQLGGAVYLKSIAGIKSRCIYFVRNKTELTRAWRDYHKLKHELDESLYNDFKYLNFRFHYPDPRETVLIEKAITGQQISVLSLVDTHRIWHAPSVCDIYTAKDLGRDDSFLAFRILPSKLSTQYWKEAKQISATATQILGLRNCAVHSELIVEPTGEVKIIEIASRIGGYRSDMYQYAYNFYVPDLLIRAVIGQPVKKRKQIHQYVSQLEIFPKKNGKFVRVNNFKEVENDLSVLKYNLKVKKGEKIGLARENYPPAVTMLIGGYSYQEVWEKSVYYQKQLEVVVNSD